MGPAWLGGLAASLGLVGGLVGGFSALLTTRTFCLVLMRRARLRYGWVLRLFLHLENGTASIHVFVNSQLNSPLIASSGSVFSNSLLFLSYLHIVTLQPDRT